MYGIKHLSKCSSWTEHLVYFQLTLNITVTRLSAGQWLTTCKLRWSGKLYTWLSGGISCKANWRITWTVAASVHGCAASGFVRYALIQVNMSQVGNWSDNAPKKSFFDTLKTKCVFNFFEAYWEAQVTIFESVQSSAHFQDWIIATYWQWNANSTKEKSRRGQNG